MSNFYNEQDIIPLAGEHQFRTMFTRMGLMRHKKDWKISSQELAKSLRRDEDLFTPGVIYKIYKGQLYATDNDYYGEMNF